LISEIYKNFSEGDRISLSDIKEKIKNIYNIVGYQKGATASDIKEWFKVNDIYVTTKEGKRSRGYNLIKKLL
jgi:hypothetical protein